jgi:hypothetical protein
MRLRTGLTRVEFTLLARRRATGRAPDILYPVESGMILGIHDS